MEGEGLQKAPCFPESQLRVNAGSEERGATFLNDSISMLQHLSRHMPLKATLIKLGPHMQKELKVEGKLIGKEVCSGKSRGRHNWAMRGENNKLCLSCMKI